MAAKDAGRIDVSSRPAELQDPLNYYFYHPLAARLARLLRPTGISPNLVSVGSAIALVLATWAFVSLAWPINAMVGLGFMLCWHVVDGADGDLARLTGKASATGELVDGVCDYFGNIVMYVAFAFWLDDTLGGWAWALASGAGASHILQTNHSETQRRLYAWRVYGRLWLRPAAEAGDDLFRSTTWFARYFGFWAKGYVWLSNLMSPSANPVDTALSAAEPDKAARIRALIRGQSAASLALEKALGANPKTFLIAASIALGGPLYFFLAMLTALNLILLISILHHKRMERRFAALISAL
jgi:phosphatidylglycerophosphate synthase